MRILMLNNEFPPLGGGTGTVNLALFQHFAGVPDLEIDLITSAIGSKYEEMHYSERVRLFKVPVNNRIIHHSSNRELLTYFARALPLAVKLKRSRHYDLGFAFSTIPAGQIAWALSNITGLKYVVRVSGPDIPGFERRYTRIYPILTPMIRSVWRRADVIVAKCTHEAGMIKSIDGSLSVTLIPNGVYGNQFGRKLPLLKEGPLRILCVGRLIERKGQDQLIEAVGRLNGQGIDATLELVGTGDALESYQLQAKKLRLTDRVHFAGYVPREEIAKHYYAADVFVLPSYNEGMSLAALEAMASGLPLILTRTGGTSDLVDEGVNGFTFDCGDVNALTGILSRLANQKELLEPMGVASRERSEKFSWDVCSNRYLDLFNHFIHPQ